MAKGYVVMHKETGNEYAVSEGNFNPKTESKKRDLKKNETVRGYVPRPRVKANAADVPFTELTKSTNPEEKK